MAEKKITRADGTPVTSPASDGEKKEKAAPKTSTVKKADAAASSAKKTVKKADEAAPAAKKTVKKADEAAPAEPTEEKPAEPAEESAEKKPAVKKVKKADGTEASVKPAAPVKEEGSATGLRIGAVALWVGGIVLEVLAILMILGKIGISILPTVPQFIVTLVLDFVCVCIGSVLWKKANRIDPASEANKLKFWLWNNMGLIAAVVAFVPFIIISLTNKNADKKTKTIATVVAAILLLISGLVGYDWNPISAEDKEAAVEVLADQDVYWSRYGKVYHTSSECSHLNRSDELTVGTVEQAIEANRTRLCKTCADRDNIDIDAAKADSQGLPVVDENDTELPDTQDAEGDDLVIDDGSEEIEIDDGADEGSEDTDIDLFADEAEEDDAA